MSDIENDDKNSADNIISDMVLNPEGGPHARGGLMVEPQEENNDIEFALQLEATLKETEVQMRNLPAEKSAPEFAESWENARGVVTDFRPVPWFIWRLSNFVLGQPGHVNEVTEGFVLGLRRLLFAAASDPVLGRDDKINDVKKALRILPSDVVAAVSVIHAVCRRLASRQFERIWRSILDDALLRARIGYILGGQDEEFGAGRGMLAGFAGRSGLAVLISSGNLAQARAALELLATGAEIQGVGSDIYRCEPLQVSAMTLSAAGCGRDAALGTASFASPNPLEAVGDDPEQLKWLSAFAICEFIRAGTPERIPGEYWNALGFKNELAKVGVRDDAKKIARRGHGWPWLV